MSKFFLNHFCFLQSYTQYIPLSVYDLELWLGTPSIYVFDCSAAGVIVNAFCEVRAHRHLKSAFRTRLKIVADQFISLSSLCFDHWNRHIDSHVE